MSTTEPNGINWLRHSGEFTIVEAQEWKPKLVQALKQSCPTGVDLTAVTEIGLSGVQLLVAARRGFVDKGVSFAVRDPGGLVQAACEAIGLPFDGDPLNA